MNNDLYNITIERDGKTYRYDPDYNCWYQVYTHEEWSALPHWEKFGWIWVTLLCAIFAAIATYCK